MLATKTRDEATVRPKTPARRKAPQTFDQLRATLAAASEAYDAALEVQGKADLALFAFRESHGAGYEQADGYAEVRAASDRAEASADKPCRAHMRAIDRILAFPTLAPDELALKRALVADFSILCPDDHDDPAMTFIDSTMEALRTTRVCRPDPAIARAWSEAMASYRAAQAAVAFQSKASNSLYLKADIPERLRAPSLHYGVQCRWREEEDLIDDLLITPEVKAELLPILREHLLRPESHLRLINPDDEDAIAADEEATGILYDVCGESLVCAVPVCGMRPWRGLSGTRQRCTPARPAPAWARSRRRFVFCLRSTDGRSRYAKTIGARRPAAPAADMASAGLRFWIV